MTDKQLQKMSRTELLEILLAQEKEIAALQEQLDQANAQLEKREIDLQEAGSIAEAALRLNGVFEAAQAAAEQYIYSVKALGRKELT